MPSSDINISINAALNGASRPADINEYLIECYVRFVDSLDKARQAVIEDHVKNYINGTAVERFYRQFYNEYDKLDGQISPKVEKFVASMFD